MSHAQTLCATYLACRGCLSSPKLRAELAAEPRTARVASVADTSAVGTPGGAVDCTAARTAAAVRTVAAAAAGVAAVVAVAEGATATAAAPAALAATAAVATAAAAAEVVAAENAVAAVASAAASAVLARHQCRYCPSTGWTVREAAAAGHWAACDSACWRHFLTLQNPKPLRPSEATKHNTGSTTTIDGKC